MNQKKTPKQEKITLLKLQNSLLSGKSNEMTIIKMIKVTL